MFSKIFYSNMNHKIQNNNSKFFTRMSNKRIILLWNLIIINIIKIKLIIHINILELINNFVKNSNILGKLFIF